jgi:hypothetical protein
MKGRKLIAEKVAKLEHIPIRGRVDYASILSLSTEVVRNDKD